MPAPAQHRHPRSTAGGVVQQRRLADAGFAAQDHRAADPCAPSAEQRVDGCLLFVAAPQHALTIPTGRRAARVLTRNGRNLAPDDRSRREVAAPQ